MRLAWLLPLALFAGCSSSSKTSAPVMNLAAPNTAPIAPRPVAEAVPEPSVPLSHYSDPTTGVSFEYPAVWIPAAKDPMYLSPQLPPPYKPKTAVAFSPANNLYAKTVLQGLAFQYAVQPATNEAACFASIPANGSTASTASYNGRNYRELTGSSAGMCHEQASQIDVVYVRGQCIAFERDFNTECLGAGDGKRALTLNEQKALQRHLNEVMESVSIR